MKAPTIILDRDGVINYDSPDYIKSPEEWIPLPGSIEAIRLLSRAGFTILVATNQSGIGRGFFDEPTLARMHKKMRRLVKTGGGRIDGVYFCPHRPDENCPCRKPRTGLLDRMEAELSRGLTGAWFVGDSEKDIDCALAKGCRPALVLTGQGAAARDRLSREKRRAVRIFDDLLGAARAITAEESGAAAPGRSAPQ